MKDWDRWRAMKYMPGTAKRARRDARFAMCYVDTPLEDDTHAYPAWFARPCTRDLVTALGLEKLMRRVHVKKAIPEQIEE